MSILMSLGRRLLRYTTRSHGGASAVAKAIHWARLVHGNATKGLAQPRQVFPPSQETTGYIIPTLCQFGQRDLAVELAQWEASCQRVDGASSAVDGVPYTFDTAQVVRGFLAVLDDVPQLEINLRRACDYVESQIAPNGEVRTPSYDLWKLPDGSMLSEYGNLYVLPPMLQAGKKLGEPKYIAAAERGMDYFRSKPDLIHFKAEFSMLSHYFGYMMEALVDLGELSLAKTGLEQVARIQKSDGSIPAYPGATWVCSTGIAQLALAWYKLGDSGPADKALDYLVTLQNSSGGFYGSYGKGAVYFPTQEISWSVKFFLDACYWKTRHVPAKAWTSVNERANGPERIAADRAELQGFSGARR
jgi:malonyl-CoA O-methyltransferase